METLQRTNLNFLAAASKQADEAHAYLVGVLSIVESFAEQSVDVLTPAALPTTDIISVCRLGGALTQKGQAFFGHGPTGRRRSGQREFNIEQSAAFWDQAEISRLVLVSAVYVELMPTRFWPDLSEVNAGGIVHQPGYDRRQLAIAWRALEERISQGTHTEVMTDGNLL